MKRLAPFVFALALTAGAAVAQNMPVHLELVFSNHLDNGLAEQDAYIERVPGSDQIWRVTSADVERFSNAPLYATVAMNRHNPFDAAFDGPYPKGRPLGLTLAEWLRAEGSAVYDCDGVSGTIEASFSGLVPNGLYTLWYFFVAVPPMVPFAGAYDLPVGARDGSENVFVSDGDGNADFSASFEPCLQLGGVQLAAGLGLAWHSDGHTYGANPGPFGLGTQVPIFVFFPTAEEVTASE